MAEGTASLIKKAFLGLLKDVPLKQITVRAITKECNITRNSFYYHYNSIPELLMEIVKDYVKAEVPKYASAKSLGECTDKLAQQAYAFKREIMHVYRSSDRYTTDMYLMQICGAIVETYGESALERVKLSQMDKHIILNFYKYELYGQLTNWLDSDLSQEPVFQFKRVCELIPKTGELIKEAGIEVN